jgi:hypothetical protein
MDREERIARRIWINRCKKEEKDEFIGTERDRWIDRRERARPKKITM